MMRRAVTLLAIMSSAIFIAFFSWQGASAQHSSQQAPRPMADKPMADKSDAIEFTEEFMNNEENFELGKAIWKKRCQFCHGKRAYPGKAPKLKPKRYKPEFVYKRVTNGFKGMPGWKHEFNQQERMAVTAFIMHRRFSP
ncbi:MAG: hypothetical protein GKR94_03865 [Gammaproteobacteria bacterium]|nr:hypothetical protein [Gammaproteobacteria bacterium]